MWSKRVMWVVWPAFLVAGDALFSEDRVVREGFEQDGSDEILALHIERELDVVGGSLIDFEVAAIVVAQELACLAGGGFGNF